MSGSRRALLGPLLLLALVSLGISVHVALLAPPLWDNDERAHAGYALQVWQGHLPTIDTPIPDEPDHFPQISAVLQVQRDQAHRDVWTANHPPLYYALAAPLLGAADAFHAPGAGLLAMRLLNAIGMAATVVLVGLLAAELVPDRPAVAVLAATAAAGCATVTHLGGLILNDGLAAAASSTALLLALRAVRFGPTRGRLVGIAVVGTVAAAFRATGVLTVVVCTLAVLLAGRRHGRSLGRAAAMALFVGGIPAAGIGWFYVRNIVLYGDPGATAALVSKFHRQGRGSLVDAALDPHLYLTQFRELWVREHLGWQILTVMPAVIVGLVLLGLLLAAFRARGIRPVDPLPWLLLGGYAVAIQISVIDFYKAGGLGHVRYLIPSLPLLGTAAAIGMLAFVGRRAEWHGATVFGTLLLGFAAVVQIRSSREILHSARIPGLTQSTVGGVAPWIPLAIAGIAATALLCVLIYRSGVGETSSPKWQHLHHPVGDNRTHHGRESA